ncbi:trifunctional glycosyltransferase/class I SAM-dependent methyltransferase/polysaccharide deacetylase [Sphingomonas profundi]|uniref:trifunctional glycosyltransferase/class I SAM-dependent methyltransferase/polysaccharide deacetylase n=1 Tax=Alterirhizorhabdus profundi TaxID=2681549 RepID=UPI0018D1817A|nr:trifunctional glycosyltransferase/class I SAM-dependent methyltransferase/polysaccharide deacetylase [Sphingomonas profundi]
MNRQVQPIAAGPPVADDGAPRVSIVIPAYQAAATLDRALDSLVQQTFADWEAIVVDDGSTDVTAAVIASRAAGDPRIRAFRQPNLGASAARNHGLREARGEWIGFLDADDWFHPAFLKTLTDLARDHPQAGTVYCDFALVDRDGRILEEQRVPDLSDPFGTLARSCVLSVHCALTRAGIMRAAGPFDETLALNEDWDLWQRIARLGAPFRGVREMLAFYYCRPQSLSRRPLSLATDGLAVIDRVCRADPAVPARDPRYADGLPDEDRLPLKLDWILMCAANAIALGEDPLPYLDMIGDYAGAVLIAEHGVATFVGGLAFGRCTDSASLADGWDGLEPQVDRFWQALGARIGQTRAIDTCRALARLRVLGPAAFDRPFASSGVHVRRVDIAQPLPVIDPRGCDAVIVQVVEGEGALGLVHLPALGLIPPAALREAIVAAAPTWPERRRIMRSVGAARPLFWLHAAAAMSRSRGWGIKARIAQPGRIAGAAPLRVRAALARTLGRSIGGRLRYGGTDAAYREAIAAVGRQEAGRLAGEQAAAGTAGAAADAPAWREVAANSPAYWDQVFEQENPWAYDSVYEQTKYEYTLDLIGPDRPAAALELACAEGHFTVQLAARVGHLLATDISTIAIGRAAERCAGQANVDYAQLDFFDGDIAGDYDLITCSEVLYECGSLPKLRTIARRIADRLKPGGALVMAHVIEASEERARSGFDWDGVFGARTIAEVFGAVGGLALEAQIETELYRIHRFRKTDAAIVPKLTTRPIKAPPLPEYGAYVVWGGATVTRSEAARARAVALPILMYHRIAERDDGPAALAQYRLSPADFEAQLRWLRRHGYRGVTPAEWIAALARDQPLEGRPVMLTFDDGYCDFATAAWPLLQHYGMAATVGIVTDKVGGRADWDVAYGPPAPLIDWEALRRVAREGAVIASHSASHAALPALSGEAVLREAFRSRLAIGQALGREPDTIIYPYGAYDPLAARAAALAGYGLGLGTTPGIATLLSDPMHMPRIEVSGFGDLDGFVDALRRTDAETGRPRPAA